MVDLTSTRKPVGRYQANHHWDLTVMLGRYHERTPGIFMMSRMTVLLPTGDLIQPHLSISFSDACTFAPPDGSAKGAPQLAIDMECSLPDAELEERLRAFASGGVGEYMFMSVYPWECRWYRNPRYQRRHNHGGVFQRVMPDEEGIVRSSTCPGLWISFDAILGGEGRSRDWKAVIDRGLASPEHQEFMGK
jgi:hypothetical protein